MKLQGSKIIVDFGGAIENAVIESDAVDPSELLTAGRLFYNTSELALKVYNGTAWAPIGSSAGIPFGPTDPVGVSAVGSLFFNTTTSLLKVYDGAAWIDVSNSLAYGATDPVTSTVGTLFYNTTSSLLKVYNGSAWTIVGSVVDSGTTDPSTGNVVGKIFYNTTVSALKVYSGSAWAIVGSGSVTSVALNDGSTLPIYSVTGSPVVNSGALTLTLVNQTANKVFAGPATGAAAQPSFRSLVSADIPSSIAANTSGTAASLSAVLIESLGGTGQSVYTLGDTLYAAGPSALLRLAGNTSGTRKFLRQSGNGTISAAPAWDTVTATDVGLGSVTNDAQVRLSTVTAKGNLIAGTGSGTVSALTVGANDFVLTADSAQATGLKWAAIPPPPTVPVSSVFGRIGAVIAVSGDYSFSLISGTAVETQGGTNQTSYALGDTLYASGVNTLSKLAGNTLATRKFLRQTGTGLASTSPAWDTVTATDVGLGSVTNNAQVRLSTVTAKGDIIAGTGAAAVSSLNVGTDTFVLTADSTQTTGLRWTAPPTVPVSSVFGRTGAVIAVAGDYTKSDIGLGNVTNSAQVTLATVTAKGDLITGTGSAAVTALAVGSDTHVLTADSAQTSGLKWAAIPTAPVASVFGRTGIVTAQSGDYSFSLISGTAVETQGGTNQISYALGDTLYSSASNTLSKLTGNITATKKVLTQTGTGSASAAPTWDTVTKSDVGLGNVTDNAQVRLSTVAAKGDLIVGTASATVAALTVGTDTHVLTADGTQTSGVKWAAVPSAPVSSVFGRTSAVIAQSGDYSKSDVGLSNVTNNSQVTLATVTAKGDLIAGTGSAAVTALPVGANTFVLTADSTQTSGIRWAAPPSVPWATYTGAQAAPTVTASSGALALNFGPAALSITETGTPLTAFYAGSGITVTGVSDRNIIMWGGGDTTGAATSRTLTCTALTEAVIIVPGDNGSRTAQNQSVVIGCRSIALSATCVAIGFGAVVGNTSGTAVAIGQGAAAIGVGSVAIGGGGTSTNGSASIAIGNITTANAAGVVAIGNNIFTSSPWSVGIGSGAQPEFSNEVALHSGSRATRGDAKTSLLTQWVQTTNATPAVMGVHSNNSGAPNTFITLPINCAYYFDVRVVGFNQTTKTDAFVQTHRFLGLKGATNATFAMSAVTSDTAITIGTTTGWSVSITADTTTGGPKITVTGVAATNIQWVATFVMTKAA